jgi:hypothetical protein
MAPVSGKEVGIIGSAGWEDCPMASQHMHFTDLSLNNFIEMEHFISNFWWLVENFRCLNTR